MLRPGMSTLFVIAVYASVFDVLAQTTNQSKIDAYMDGVVKDVGDQIQAAKLEPLRMNAFSFKILKTGIINRDVKANVTVGRFEGLTSKLKRDRECELVFPPAATQPPGNLSIKCNVTLAGVKAIILNMDVKGDSLIGTHKNYSTISTFDAGLIYLQLHGRPGLKGTLTNITLEKVTLTTTFDNEKPDLNPERFSKFSDELNKQIAFQLFDFIRNSYSKFISEAITRKSPVVANPLSRSRILFWYAKQRSSRHPFLFCRIRSRMAFAIKSSLLPESIPFLAGFLLPIIIWSIPQRPEVSKQMSSDCDHFNDIRIVCMSGINGSEHTYVQQEKSWGRRCNLFRVADFQEDPWFNRVHVHQVFQLHSAKKRLGTDKLIRFFEKVAFMYKHYKYLGDWYLIAAHNHYVAVDNIRRLVLNLDPKQPQAFVFSTNLILLSNSALSRLATRIGDRDINLSFDLPTNKHAVCVFPTTIGACLRESGVRVLENPHLEIVIDLDNRDYHEVFSATDFNQHPIAFETANARLYNVIHFAFGTARVHGRDYCK